MMASEHFTYRTACPLCKQEGDVLFSKAGRTVIQETQKKRVGFSPAFYDQTKYELLHCRSCDHYYQSYIPTPDAYVGTFGEEQSALSLQRKIVSDLAGDNLRKIEILPALLKKPAHQIAILEFGAGWGFLLQTAQSLGHPVVGVEIAPGRIAYARAHGLTIVDDLESLGDKQYDYIHTDQVMEHLPDPLAMLKKIAGHLTPGGIMFIGVPNGDRFRKKYDQNPSVIYKDVFPFEHVQCFTHHSLETLGILAGLRPVSPLSVIRSLLSRITLTNNLHFVQEAFKIASHQKHKTTLYFKKERIA